MNELLNAAFHYASMGWFIFPCIAGDKNPLTANGCHDATVDEEIIRSWWTRWPDANIGFNPGPSGMVAVDVDHKHGKVPGLASWKTITDIYGKQLENTLCQETPSGGLHFIYEGQAPNAKDVLGLGIEVRCLNWYILLAPSLHPEGGTYQWAIGQGPDDIAPAPFPQVLLDKLNTPHPRTKHVLSAPLGEDGDPGAPIGEGARNDSLFRAACSLRGRNVAEEVIYQTIHTQNATRCVPPLPLAEVDKIILSALRYAPNQEHSSSSGNGDSAENVSPDEERKLAPEDSGDIIFTDIGNGMRFAQHYIQTVHYSFPQDAWFIWNDCYWQQDQNGEIFRRAKAVARSIYTEADQAKGDSLKKALAKHAIHSSSQYALQAMLAAARSEPGIPVQPAQWDADPWLLNVQNGTIDLRDGSLRPHDPNDLLTRIIPAEYHPDAVSPLWERFLRETTGEDAQTQAYLARAVGYSLTGITSEEKLFFVHGPAASGKSTFIETIKATLGDYAMTADFETFLARSFTGGIRNDIARLAGARFVASIEVDEGKKLAEGLVKTITGGDTVTARFLHQEAFEFRPQFALWLCANHRPPLDDSDDAMWRRIDVIPFIHSVPPEKRDPTLKKTLRDPALSGAAILAWAVRGCLEWQRQGLGTAPKITEATAAYREEQDPLSDFITECCVESPTATVSSAALIAAYQQWYRTSGGSTLPMLTAKKVMARLKERGCKTSENLRQGDHILRGVIGLGLRVSGGEEQAMVIDLPPVKKVGYERVL